jgi:Mn2+/Fe2+ NRAMP family transporter
VAVGAAIASFPNLPLIRVLLVTQVINGLLLPVSPVRGAATGERSRADGQSRQWPLYNLAAWLTAMSSRFLSLLFILITLFPGSSIFKRGHR